MTWKFDESPPKTIGHLSWATAGFGPLTVAICGFKLELQQRGKFGENLFWPLWTLFFTSDLELLHGHHFCQSWYLNNSIYSNLGLCALLRTFHVPSRIVANISGPSLPFSLALGGLTGVKRYQKVTIAIFRFVLQNCIIPGYFPYIHSIAIFSPYVFGLVCYCSLCLCFCKGTS